MSLYEISSKKIIVPQNLAKIPVRAEYDLIVAGGGVAGISAAIAAGREGVKTLLIERNGFLGGTATAAAMAILGAPYSHAHGIYREICDRLIEAGGGSLAKTCVVFDPEVFKWVVLEMLNEAGVTVMPYTVVVDAILDENRTVKGLVICNKQGQEAILSKVTIDCTGDADVAYYSGAQYQMGREKDEKMRPLTLIFRIGNVDFEKLKAYADKHPEKFSNQPDKNLFDLENNAIRLFGFFEELERARSKGEITGDIHYLRFEGGNVKAKTLFLNTTRVYHKDGTNAEHLFQSDVEARKQIDELLAFLRKYVPGCEDCVLLDTANNLGVRETRRIIGEFIFDEEHVASKTLFPDRIAVNYQYGLVGAPMHSPDGGEGSMKDSRERGGVKAFLHGYSLPYRILIPKGINSLLVAGRCLSVTHLGDHWTRPMPTCMITGQAAGVAAALAIKTGLQPRDLKISDLQEALRSQKINLEKFK